MIKKEYNLEYLRKIFVLLEKSEKEMKKGVI